MREEIKLPAEYSRFGRYLWDRINMSNPGDKSTQEVLDIVASSLIGMRNDDGFMHELDIWASDRRDTGNSWGTFGQSIRTSWPEFFAEDPPKMKHPVRQQAAAWISITTMLDLADRLVEERDIHSLTMLQHLNDQLINAGVRGNELELKRISKYLATAAELLGKQLTAQEVKSTTIRTNLTDNRHYEPWKLAESESLTDADLDDSLWCKRQSEGKSPFHTEFKAIATYLWNRINLVDSQYAEETKALRDIAFNLAHTFDDGGFMLNLSIWANDRANKSGSELKKLWPELF